MPLWTCLLLATEYVVRTVNEQGETVGTIAKEEWEMFCANSNYQQVGELNFLLF